MQKMNLKPFLFSVNSEYSFARIFPLTLLCVGKQWQEVAVQREPGDRDGDKTVLGAEPRYAR